MQVAGALIESAEGLLLVCNRRRDGRVDWSPPGGMIDPDDDDLLSGLAREVFEETHLHVAEWSSPCYSVSAIHEELGWHLKVEVYRALSVTGTLHVDDPDRVVIEARYFRDAALLQQLALAPRWVREPLTEWMRSRGTGGIPLEFEYRVSGSTMHNFTVEPHVGG